MTGRHSLGPCGKTLVRLLVYSKRIQTLGVSLILFISQAISLRVLRAPHKCHFRNISQDSSQLDPITYFQHTEMILCPPGVRVGGLAFINIKYFHMSKSKCASHSVMSSSLWPHDCSPPGSSSMEFSRQEYWSGQPFPSPENLLNSGIEPGFLHCRQILYCLSHQTNPTTSFQYTEMILCPPGGRKISLY